MYTKNMHRWPVKNVKKKIDTIKLVAAPLNNCSDIFGSLNLYP